MSLTHALQRSRDYLVICLLNLVAWGAIAHGWRDPRLSAVRILPAPTPSPGPTATPVRLVVYVSGAVATPGVVRLPEGARAADAVSAAGGLAARADPVAVNLAAPLTDGEQLFIPERVPTDGLWPGVGGGPSAAAGGAQLAASSSREPSGANGTGGRTGTTGGSGRSGTASAHPGGGAPGGARRPTASQVASSDGSVGEAGSDLTNVNTATAGELEALPSIGPALAARIIAYREEHGPFGSVDDLLNVSGIGSKTLARFKARVVAR